MKARYIPEHLREKELKPVIYIGHFNYDYHERLEVYPNLADALTDIRNALQSDNDITSIGLAKEATNKVGSGPWKGLTLHAVDPERHSKVEIDLMEAVVAVRSNHTLLPFEQKLRQALVR
jgi:hypothetical protein